MKLITKNTWLIVGGLFLIELASFFGYFYPPFKIISALLISVAVFVIAFKNLELSLLVLFVELIIGSKGHLFEVGPVSIRIIIFSAIILAYLYKLRLKDERLKIKLYLTEFKAWYFYTTLGIFVALSLIIAFLNHNVLGNIFSDFNAWLFLLLLFPVISIYFKAETQTYQRLVSVVIAAFLWLGLETSIILYIFTHNFGLISDMYLWLRKTGVAEITPTLGSWPRIFIQSQIYAAMALAIIPFALKKINQSVWLLMSIAWVVVLLSMSRSFWLAIIIVFAIGVLLILIFQGWKKMWPKLFLIGGSAVIGIMLIIAVTIFPVPKPGNFSADSFINRVSLDSGEAAVASRWSLLPAMEQQIKRSPIFGFGYGKTITYKSSDPRVLQTNPGGQYTTYAFEWGYLGLWLKLGLFGLLAYLSLLGWLIYRGFAKWRAGNSLAGALALGLLVLVIIHFFTPYLDHPLGFAYLILASCFLEMSESKKTEALL